MARVLAGLVGDTAAFAKLMEERRPEVFRTAGWPTGLPRPSELDDVLRGGLLRVPYVELRRSAATGCGWPPGRPRSG
ncbi:hypothetical protein [Kitasatospora sp. HPMI-4]|uniref:hypothetical protein n=1 Tax=Kitasatospora sp. HPMI-4 TaxID=3448443 RepID=UPI003F1BB993